MPTSDAPFASSIYLWSREDGETVTLGEYRFSSKPAGAVFHVTEDRATAKLWARELAAGRNPSRKFRDEPKPEQQPAASIVVYDLPPGAEPVLHRAREGAETPVSHTEAPLVRRGSFWVREDTGETVAERWPVGSGVFDVYSLTGTSAEIDRQAAALIDALAAGKEAPTSQ